MSQIERSKTRPTVETVEWLAERLGVDAGLLLTGISSTERDRWEGALARAEALNEQYRYAEAAPEFARVLVEARAAGVPELELRALAGEGWARMQEGELKEAARCSRRRARSPRTRASPISSAPTSSSASARAAISCRASRRRSASSTPLSISQTAPSCRAICFARRSSAGVRVAIAASATGRPPGRTSNGRSSSSTG